MHQWPVPDYSPIHTHQCSAVRAPFGSDCGQPCNFDLPFLFFINELIEYSLLKMGAEFFHSLTSKPPFSKMMGDCLPANPPYKLPYFGTRISTSGLITLKFSSSSFNNAVFPKKMRLSDLMLISGLRSVTFI